MRVRLQLPISVKDIKAVAAVFTALPDDIIFQYITTDSRECENNDLFFAIRGEKFNGENFAEEAKQKGAYVVSAKREHADFLCESTEDVLLSLVKCYKQRLQKIKATVAITGSVGKTTAKDFCSAMLRAKYKTHKTPDNYNNSIGVAYTVFSTPLDTEVLILELGMNHKGEIEKLSNAVNPDYALITNIGNSHIGNFGSLELIAKAKLEILSGMFNNNLIAPHEDKYLSGKAKYTFSTENKNSDFSFKKGNNGFIFRVSDKNIFEFRTSYFALHHIKALLSALSVGYLLGMNKNELMLGCKLTESVESRQKFIELKNFTIFDDTYSSSPEAVESVFEYLNLAAPSKSKVCVLGDMLELGTKTEEMHEYVGKLVAKYGFKYLFTFGVYGGFIKKGALESGFNRECIHVNPDTTAPQITADAIVKKLSGGEIIVVKASHAIHAERIIEEIRRIENQYA